MMVLLSWPPRPPPTRPAGHDLVIYGGTSAGVMAAVQAKRMGKDVVIVCPDQPPGRAHQRRPGVDRHRQQGRHRRPGREFYHRIWQHYHEPDAWKWQKREEYGNQGQGTPAIDGQQRTMWIFEPHVAERVFEDLRRRARHPGASRRVARPRRAA